MHWGDRSGIGAGEGWSSALARCMLMFARRAHAHASLRRPFDVRMWSAELRGAHRITYISSMCKAEKASSLIPR